VQPRFDVTVIGFSPAGVGGLGLQPSLAVMAFFLRLPSVDFLVRTPVAARPFAAHAQPVEQILVASILQKSTATLEEEEERRPGFMRWELGA